MTTNAPLRTRPTINQIERLLTRLLLRPCPGEADWVEEVAGDGVIFGVAGVLAVCSEEVVVTGSFWLSSLYHVEVDNFLGFGMSNSRKYPPDNKEVGKGKPRGDLIATVGWL